MISSFRFKTCLQVNNHVSKLTLTIIQGDEPEAEPEVEPEVDEEVEKYVKMIRIGIPAGAVENKMKLDNVDPAQLQPYL